MDHAKVCNGCKQTKPLAEFCRNRSTRDGYHHHCNECKRRLAKKSDKRRRESIRTRKLDYYRQNQEQIRGRIQRYKAEHPQVAQANSAVAYAVETGKLPQVTVRRCSECGAPATEYHHPSYKQQDWLRVIPLCRSCHRGHHNGAEQ